MGYKNPSFWHLTSLQKKNRRMVRSPGGSLRLGVVTDQNERTNFCLYSLRSKWMAQIPKGRIVKGPSKPICRDCTIYFWITVSWFFTCLMDSTMVKTPSNHHLGNIFRWFPTTEQANLKRRGRQFWGASFRTSCFSINYSDQAGAWSPQNAGKKGSGRGPSKIRKKLQV